MAFKMKYSAVKKSFPFKHGDMPHPKGVSGEEIDSGHSEIYGRDHNESDHERWAAPDTPPVEEPTVKGSRKLGRKLRKQDRKEYREAKREWRRGDKEGDKPERP